MNKYSHIVSKLNGVHPGPPALLPPLEESHLSAIESRLGFTLPPDYREFLRDYAFLHLGHNSTFPLVNPEFTTEGEIYSFIGSTEKEDLAEYYFNNIEGFGAASMSGDEEIEVYAGIHLIRDVPRPYTDIKWPEELMPIGYDMTYNVICLALFGLRQGSIFYFVSNPIPGEQNIYLVADSFDKFMNLLVRR